MSRVTPVTVTVNTLKEKEGVMASRPTSHLLSLPSELRNLIYELTFLPTTDEPADLCRPQPPSKGLLLTCRKTYQEARLMRRKAYRAYWEQTIFHYIVPANDELTELGKQEWWMVVEDARLALAHLEKADLAHVKRLRVVVEASSDIWAYNDGVWALWSLDPDGTSMTYEYSNIWFLEGLDGKMRRAGFVDHESWTEGWWTVDVTQESAERSELAKEIAIKRHGLTMEELLCAVLE